MSAPGRDTPGPDLADRLLAAAVALLPDERAQWGRAMRAELGGIEPARDRRRFVLGCLRAVLTRPPVLRTLGCDAALLAILAATLVWSARIGYAPLRWGVVAVVSVLLLVTWCGRRPGALGPVGRGRAPRLVRALGCALVAAMALGNVLSVGSHGDSQEQAAVGVPVYAAVLTCYLLAFLVLTAGPTGRRGAVGTRALVLGTAAGTGAAGTWVAVLATSRPMPTTVLPVVVLIAAGMGLAAAALVLTGRGAAAAGEVVSAALYAGTVAALLVVEALAVLSTYGPASMIPDLASVALTPAADLAQSRNEIEDPYVGILFLGCLLAAALCTATVLGRRRPPPAGPDAVGAQAPGPGACGTQAADVGQG